MVKKRKWNTRQEDPHQGILEAALSTIFPTRNVTKNVRKKVSITNPLTGGYLEVDLWYEDLKLCFEYQDEHHYQPSWYSHIPLDVLQEKDDIKRSKLLQKGETLIQVPCWWDGTAESLQATIHFYRPDLLPLPQHMHPVSIPANPSQHFFSVSSSGDKRLMLASFPTSVLFIEEITRQNPWWLGEKYDGVRCFWNFEDEQLYSRNRMKIDLHPAVTKMFGHVMLDGEIWCGRGHFLESLVPLSAPQDKVDWALLRVVCFDEASWHMRDQPFEARYWLILSNYPPHHPVVITAPRFSCSSVTALVNSLHQVIEGGGEGVILRRPYSVYQPGRSSDLIKLKGTRSDQEALVVDVEEDGSLLLKLPNGTTFVVAKVDCELPRRAVRGDVVTFSHDFSRRIGMHDLLAQDNTQRMQRGAATMQEAVRGVPANIVVHRIRTDVFWEDVMNNAGQLVRQFHNESYQKIDDTTKPISLRKFWEVAQNRRELLETFASSKGYDPLSAHFWYNFNPIELSSVKGTRAIRENYVETVVHLFPELHMDTTKFKRHTGQSWKLEADRRTFFDKYAASKGMDPRNPYFWSGVSTQELCRFEPGYKAIAAYYGGRLSTCLMQLYPDIGLKQSHFGIVPKWDLDDTRRSALLHFARTRSFDPLVPANWYQLSWGDFSVNRMTRSMLTHCYNQKHSVALMDLFPELKLEASNFVTAQSWRTEADRRAFFDNFAASKGMDPRNPVFWSRVTVREVRRYQPGFTTIAGYHEGRLSTCLMQLYPDIGLKWHHFVNGNKRRPQEYLERVAK